MSLLRVEQEPEIRLGTYEKALELLEDHYNEGKYYPYAPRGEELGLCILLPCILWDLNNYLDPDPNEEYWNYSDTTRAFPELAKYLITIENTESDWEMGECRIKCLKQMIQEVKLEMEAKHVSR